jgi:hypothetical protein
MSWWWLAGAIGAVAAVLAVRRAASGYPAPPRPYRRLFRGEAAFLAAAAEATFPPGGPIPYSGRQADLPGYLDRLLDASVPRNRMMMHLLFMLVEQAPLVFPAPGRGGRRRFSRLDGIQQVQALAAWNRRGFPGRLVFTSLRALLTLGYFAYPPVLRHLHLAPYAIEPRVCEADLWYPPIGKGPEAVRARPTELSAPGPGTPLDLSGPLDPRYAGTDA